MNARKTLKLEIIMHFIIQPKVVSDFMTENKVWQNIVARWLLTKYYDCISKVQKNTLNKMTH